ncbi:CsbD family protein [Kushneria indalinina]|uniref:CsbD-like protein n=1 Tax=Kushneria indalinina DSM 14324 TaxID=1122140 RepID=A0A3D9DYH5_9GAMM|nr:CsbD family protein [Kushneria indalinina]REC95840.1 CsbD-like protein [Kushneria indalinina DSM 14324]
MSDKSPPLEDLKGKVKEAWGTLCDDEALSDEGEIQQLAARLEKEQGLSAEEAQRQAESSFHGRR